jgi:hypothetical protein
MKFTVFVFFYFVALPYENRLKINYYNNMHLTPLIFISVLLYAIIPQQNNYTESTFFSYQLDSIPNKAGTTKVHNYLTPIPLSELGDSILNEFLPSLEGTIIATKEFKERYDMVVKYVSKTYKKDALANGRIVARTLARDYLAYSEKNMYQIDSLLGDYYLRLSTSWEPCTYCPHIGYDLTKMSGKRKTTLAIKDSIKEAFFNKLFCAKLFDSNCDDIISDFGYRFNRLNYYSLSGYHSVRVAPKFYYPYLPSSCSKYDKNRRIPKGDTVMYQVNNNIMNLPYCEPDWNSRLDIALINTNIKQPEPYIILYSPQDSDKVALTYQTNPINPKYSYNYFGVGLMSCPVIGRTYYILALAESTDGQMLAGIRPFKISDTTAYTMELQPMEWTAFEKAVNALK